MASHHYLGLLVLALHLVSFGHTHRYYYGRVTSSSSSSGGTKSYTVSSDFYDFLTEARAGGANVRPKITSNSDGTFTITITTSKGTRQLKHISNSSVELFAKLFTNSSTKITVVSRSGSNVKISVSDGSSSSSEEITSSSSSEEITSSSSSDEITSSSSSEEVTSISSSEEITSSISSGGQAIGTGTISRDGSQDVKYYTVSSKFYDFITAARKGGSTVRPKITTGSDGSLSITIQTGQGSRELKNVSKDLVDLFVQLFSNPDLKISVVSKSGSNVKISVSEEDESDDSSSVQLNSETIQLIKDFQTNANLKLTHVSEKDGVYTLTVSDEGKTKTISGIPSKVAKLIIHKAQNPDAKINISTSGKSNIAITSTTTTKTTYTVSSKFLKVYNYLKKHPTSHLKVTQGTDGTYKLTITSDDKTKTYINVDLSLIQLLIFLYKNPKLDFKVSPQSDGEYTIVLPKNADDTPTTSSIPKDFVSKLEKILDNPKIKVKIEEPSTGHYQLDVDDGSGDKTYEIPKSLIPVIEKLLKLPKGKDGKPNYHILSKDDKNHHISLDTKPDKTTHPADSTFITFIKKLEKNPDLAKQIKYSIHPTDDGFYDITVTLDSKKYVFKKLPHNFVEFFINFVNKPKDTPHTITEHDTHDKDKKPHETKDKPHKPTHTLTVDEPDDEDIPLKIDDATKQEPSTTEFPSKDKGKPKHHKPSEDDEYEPKHRRPTSEEDDGHKPKHHKTTSEEDDGHKPKHHKPTSEEDDGHKPKHHKPTSEEDDGHKPKHHKPTSEEDDGHKPKHHRPTSEEDGEHKPKHRKPTSEEDDGHKSKHHKPTSEEDDGHKPKHHKPTSEEGDGHKPKHHKPTSEEGDEHRPKHHRPTSSEEDDEHRPKHHRPTSSEEDLGHKPRHHRPTSSEEDDEHKPRHHRPRSSEEDDGHKPRHHRPRSSEEDDGHRPRHHRPTSSEEDLGHKPRHHRPTSSEEDDGHKRRHHRPTSSEEDDDRRHHKTKDNTHEKRRVYHPKEGKPSTLDLLNTVKNSPHLKISVTPKKPGHYDIVVDDGVHKTTYEDIPVKTLTGLIKIRNNKHLPFEILPSDKPGHVTIKVPDGKSPDTQTFSVSPDILEVTDILTNEPKTEVEITPDKKDHFTVTIKKGDKKQSLKDLPSDVVEILVRLRTDDTLTFDLKPGKDGKIDLIVPKQHPKPVETELTRDILNLIDSVKKNSHQTFEILPGKKPNTLTIDLKDKDDTKTYPDIDIQLVPILSKIYITPSIDFEIKPTKDDSIEFIPSHPRPDDHHFEVPIRVFDIISSIRGDTSTTLKIKHTKHQDYSVTVSNDDDSKTYKNIKPNDVRLIVDFQANDDLPFSVKPTHRGVILILPSTDDTDRKVAIDSTTKKIIQEVRKHRFPDVTIEPDSDGQFTVTIEDKRYRHVSPSLLELIITLVTKPDLDFRIEPEDDGTLSVVVPKESRQTIQVKLTSEKVELINNLRRETIKHVTVKRDKKGYFDIDFDTSEGNKKLKHIKPKATQFLIDIVTNPRIPFYIYSEDDEFKLVVPKRPSEPKFTNLPKDVVEFLTKDADNPKLSLEIIPDDDEPGLFDVEFFIDGKKIKHFEELDRETIEFINIIFSHPDTKIKTEHDTDGIEVIVLKKSDALTVDFTVTREIVKLIKVVSRSDVESVSVKHGKPDTFDLTLHLTSGRKKTYSGINKKFLELISLILTRTNLDIRIYIDANGKFRVAIPKSAIDTKFEVNPDFYEFIRKIRTEISTLSFTLVLDEDDFELDVRTKSHHKIFRHLESSDIELFIQILLHPQYKLDVKKDTDEDVYIVYVVKKVAKKESDDLVITNVKSTFIQLINDLRTKTGNSITIQRKTDLTFLLGYGTKGLEFSHFEPAVILELIVRIFADANFQYSTKLDSDGTYTLTARNFKRTVNFYSLDSSLKKIGQQLTASSDALTLISRDSDKKLILGISINGGSADEYKEVDIETVIYIALSTIYKNLKFQEKISVSETIIIYVELPAIKQDYDLTLYVHVQTKTVSDISHSFGGIFGNIFGWLGNLVSGILTGAGNIVSGVGNVASNLVTGVGTAVGDVVGGVGKAVGGLLGGLFG